MSISVRRSLSGRYSNWLIGLAAALLSACAGIPQEEPRTPDVFDKIRNVDLLPRFPHQDGGSQQVGGTQARPQVYTGVVVPAIEGTKPQPTASGEGYELNFENTTVASVALPVAGGSVAFASSRSSTVA